MLAFLSRYGKMLSYLVFVVAPSLGAAIFLYGYAADQYSSRVAFAVRTLEAAPTPGLLGAITQASSPAQLDAAVLYDFLRSQKVIERIEQKLSLAEIYNRPEADGVFRLGEGSKVEDRTSYWTFMNSINFDTTSFAIEVEIRAFRPEDARALAVAVSEESEALVNKLSEDARRDAVRFAEADVVESQEQLRQLRLALSEFRNTSQDIDPNANAQLQIQLVASLEQSMAAAETQMKAMRTYLGEDAPSVRVLQRQIDSLNDQINRERAKLAGAETVVAGELTLEQRVSRFEELKVNLEFAANLYTAALEALSQAEAEARRSQRFLAVHIEPTLAEKPLYPRRLLLTLATFVCLSMLWLIVRLIALSIASRT